MDKAYKINNCNGIWKEIMRSSLDPSVNYSGFSGGMAAFLPFTGQTSTIVSASQTLPPRTTCRIFLVFLMSPSNRSKPGGKIRKSANFPGVRDPTDEKIPRVFAASEVAARITYWNSTVSGL